jgi:hypothetical protein
MELELQSAVGNTAAEGLLNRICSALNEEHMVVDFLRHKNKFRSCGNTV